MPLKPKVWVPILLFSLSTLTGAVAHEFGQSKAISENVRGGTQEDLRYNSLLLEMNGRADEREKRTQEMFKELKADIRELRGDVKTLIGHTHGP